MDYWCEGSSLGFKAKVRVMEGTDSASPYSAMPRVHSGPCTCGRGQLQMCRNLTALIDSNTKQPSGRVKDDAMVSEV